jgi:bifunctional non-homologous end joining protein LigD/DNA ligase-1
MDIFESRSASPMLLTEEKEPFDSPDYLFELKMDGIRCLAYLGNGVADLRNKENIALLHLYPELAALCNQINGNVILDGELVIMAGGKPDFEKLQRRSLMSDAFKIRLAMDMDPVTYVAFDILYCNGRELYGTPLTERKRLLNEAVRENERLAVSRVIMEQGAALYRLAESMDLEGIVAKRTQSLYVPGKRTKDWVKIKFMQEEDFIAAGYIPKEGSFLSLVLGRQGNDGLVYEGHVTLGVAREQVRIMDTSPRCPFLSVPPGNEGAVWFDHMPLCTVKYMKLTSKGGMRQPVFKGFRTGVLS